MVSPSVGEWVLLTYRVPREPSTPRIAIWRKLKQLGVAQIGDGVVALPADARTRELLDWVAEAVVAAQGTASVWLARPGSPVAERDLIEQMTAARVTEYTEVIEAARDAGRLDQTGRSQAMRRLRAEMRRIGLRDFFPPPQRDVAQAAISDLAALEEIRTRPGVA